MSQLTVHTYSGASGRTVFVPKWYHPLRPFPEYAQTESQCCNPSAVDPEGELLEAETLQLRVKPPNVEIDNLSCEDATKVTLCSANRPGTLVEVMTRLVELGLHVMRACISSDQGWFSDDFFVTEQDRGKVTDDQKLAKMKKILCVEPISKRTENRGMNRRVTQLEMSGQDRPGLLADMTQVLFDHDYLMRSAVVWTQGRSVALVMTVENMEHNKNVHLPEVVLKGLQAVLSETSDCAVTVVPTKHRGQVYDEHRGHVYDEHRLHFLLRREADTSEVERNGCNCQYQETQPIPTTTVMEDADNNFRSPKLGKPNVRIQPDKRIGYWIVTIQCKDRSKLLFDTVCTLADLDFDVYHGNVDCRNEVAVLELFIRPRYHHLESIHDSIDLVQHSLEAALVRRFPKGLKLHVSPSNHPERLGALLQKLKAADLCITRAKIGCDDYGNTVHTLCVMNSNGSLPDNKVVVDACQKVGGKITLPRCQERHEASDCGQEAIKQACELFLKERTLDVEWIRTPRSV